MSRSTLYLLVIVLAALATAGCTSVPPEPLNPAVATATASPATPASPVPATPPGQDPATRAVPVYYVAETAAGPRLQREFHGVTGADAASAAMRELLAAPAGHDPDYRSPWPAGTALRGPVTHSGGMITVDLTAPAPSDLAAQQVVFTVQGALGSSDPVRLNGTVVKRGDPYALRNLVQIDSPTHGSVLPAPLVVTGEAAVFEATLHWEVADQADGKTVRTGVASTAEGQVFAPFRFTVDLPAGTYVVTISEDDPSDGAGRPVLTDNRTVTLR